MKLLKWGSVIIGAIWTIIIFLASNRPSVVRENTNEWLNLPFIKQLPEAVYGFIASPIVFALTFFALGAFTFWQVSKMLARRSDSDWWISLGLDMSLLAYEIQDGGDILRLNAKIDVIREKAKKHSLAFPVSTGGQTIDELLPYLVQVSEHLKEGNLEIARSRATIFASNSTKNTSALPS